MDDRTRRFERLLAPYHDGALAFARCLCRSRADGDDLFQAAVLRAYDRLDDLRDEAAFRPWLYRILVTVHRDSMRRAFWRRLVPFGGDEERASGADTHDALGSAQRAQRALATLSPEQREAIVLFDIEGFTVEEIATLQAASIPAVKSRLSRGRERLRDFYTHRLEGIAPDALPAPGGAP